MKRWTGAFFDIRAGFFFIGNYDIIQNEQKIEHKYAEKKIEGAVANASI